MAAKDDGNSNAQESEESIPLETNPAISTTTIDIDPTDIIIRSEKEFAISKEALIEEESGNFQFINELSMKDLKLIDMEAWLATYLSKHWYQKMR